MTTIFIYIFILLHAFVTVKSKQWHILLVLGFKEEAPPIFVKKHEFLFILRFMLFISAVIVSFGLAAAQWYILSTVPLTVWTVAVWTGRKMAFNSYRRVLKAMLASADTDQKKELYKAASDITDQELMDIMKIILNTGNQDLKQKSASFVPSRFFE
jgi:hypothetical protein